ncbi:MAG: hypothetical protein HC927_01455 [Deltaproteobacteria bacterium]|nr:hypothetical protein [Deltaproteobacteria bacterium]
MNTSMIQVSLLIVISGAGCMRTAEDYEGKPTAEELDALRHDSCEAFCSTVKTCDPNRYDNADPPKDCFERCMTLMPKIYWENQCGSRELQWMSCVGELSCEEFLYWDIATSAFNTGPKCAAEFRHAGDCRESEPFDMNEDISDYP